MNTILKCITIFYLVDFHRMGLRRLPALSLKSEETDDQDQIMFDNVEDIILFLEVPVFNIIFIVSF